MGCQPPRGIETRVVVHAESNSDLHDAVRPLLPGQFAPEPQNLARFHQSYFSRSTAEVLSISYQPPKSLETKVIEHGESTGHPHDAVRPLFPSQM